MTIGDGATALTQEILIHEIGSEGVRALVTLHVTTCTIVNGSREDDRARCEEGELNERGSAVTVQLTLELLDRGEQARQKLVTLHTGADHIDNYCHHRLLFGEVVARAVERGRGNTVGASVTVQNEGSAPLVIHRANTSLITAGSTP